MIRSLKNKTASDVTIYYENTGLEIPANTESDMATVFQAWQLANIPELVTLLGQGIDYFQLNDGVSDLSAVDAIDLIRGYSQNVNIKTISANLPVYSKGLDDRSGHSYYKPGFLFEIVGGADNYFYQKFSSDLYFMGGGYSIPEYFYVDGAEVDQKPEKGDYIEVGVADVDNVLGYGKVGTISKVSRTTNVTTVTLSASHTFSVGNQIFVDCDDNSFDQTQVAISSVTSTTLSYSDAGDDVAEKDATGSVKKIVLLCTFVPTDYVFPEKRWELFTTDGSLVPAGIYIRVRYNSKGETNLSLPLWFNMRY